MTELSVTLQRIETYMKLEQEKQKNRFSTSVPLQQGNLSLVAAVQQLGCVGCVTEATIRGQCTFNLSLRIPISSTVLKGNLIASWPSWFRPCMWPSLRIQKVVDEGAPILGACQRGDTLEMQKLFNSRIAHPNDTNLDNLTLLYVC